MKDLKKYLLSVIVLIIESIVCLFMYWVVGRIFYGHTDVLSAVTDGFLPIFGAIAIIAFLFVFSLPVGQTVIIIMPNLLWWIVYLIKEGIKAGPMPPFVVSVAILLIMGCIFLSLRFISDELEKKKYSL